MIKLKGIYHLFLSKDNVLNVCIATVLNLVQVLLHSSHKSNFREDALQISDNYRHRLHNLQCFAFLKYAQSRKPIEIACFNEKNDSNNCYSRKLVFRVSLSGEESILFKVLLRTIFCPVCNVNVCLTDD